MTSAILDTNVLVQSLISSPRSASARVLDAYFDGRFELICSSASVDELLEALLLPRIRQRHGLSDNEVLEFVTSLLPRARICVGTTPVSHSVSRDVSDTKFLSMADETDAEFLVTNDRRHLLRLGHWGKTKIVTPTQFLKELA
jgi:putative PIN family toxin of toxin-antitoxin system